MKAFRAALLLAFAAALLYIGSAFVLSAPAHAQWLTPEQMRDYTHIMNDQPPMRLAWIVSLPREDRELVTCAVLAEKGFFIEKMCGRYNKPELVTGPITERILNSLDQFTATHKVRRSSYGDVCVVPKNASQATCDSQVRGAAISAAIGVTPSTTGGAPIAAHQAVYCQQVRDKITLQKELMDGGSPGIYNMDTLRNAEYQVCGENMPL